ncbi:MAG: DUF3501 family protein [Pirellulales bacterium]|nr:DUF3501 family protein [Pirellulales bacterium]
MAELLTFDDILSRDEYEAIRPDYRRKIMVEKRPRRVLIGSNCSAHIENREIMRYQVHEMLRAEGTFGNLEAIEDELHAYNPLITRADSLSVTFMFEYPTEDERQIELPKLVGIDRHIWLVVGELPRIAGEFDAGQIDEHKVSSVQFVHFPLTDAAQRLIATSGTVLRLVIDHPHYVAQAVLGEETRAAIARDLAA